MFYLVDMNKYQKEYIHRINRVKLHIDNNINKNLSISELARVANFSAYHFHRLFSAFTGETLKGYVARIKLEKAAGMLLMYPEMTVSEISEHCGYNNLSVFCRNFKKRFGLSSEDYRNKRFEEKSKKGQTDSKDGKQDTFDDDYVYGNVNLNQGGNLMNSKIEIKEMPELNLVYTTHIGAYDQIGMAYGKLMQWAGPRGLLSSPDVKTVTVYHDNPEVTDLDKLRQSACITVDGDVKTEGEFGNLKVPGGKYVVGRFEIDATQFGEAWNAVCVWMSKSGYQPSDGLPYELYHNNHEEHPERKFVLDICMPVKPL